MKKLKNIFSTLLLIGCIAICLTGCCNHTWVDATCTSPKTCSDCGTTEGDVEHKWIEATCTTPKTCNECGTTEGTVSHEFTATNCTGQSICSKCGSLGDPVGHKWEAATCTSPKTCTECKETDGEPSGHSTRIGKCLRCDKYVDTLAYKDDFAVVTIKDTGWMQKQDNFVDVFVIGTISHISETNDVLIVDSDNGQWTVGVGTACNLSPYIGTECGVYGFSSGGISSQHKTPLINMSHENNRITFVDGKELYPKSFESTQQFKDKFSGTITPAVSGSVWIPTDGGTKYHSKASCSGMYNPAHIPKEDALSQGFSKCGKCW